MIIVVTGPTCVGKTKMSISLAKIYNGEIINADSMQIYKGLDVGTAKVSKEEMEHVKHHLLSIKDVLEDYSVYDYQIDAREKIKDILSRGKVPILVGGTGYYIKSALYDYEFAYEENDSLYTNYSIDELRDIIDSYELGINYDRFNIKRMNRLVNKLQNGWLPNNKDFKLIYDDVFFIGLTTSRDNLYRRIDDRFDDMLVPLIDEVKPYIINNIESKALKTGIGYKEFYDFFNNKKTLKEVVDECKKNSHRYAKKQYTWFNNQMNIKWFSVNYEDFSKTVNEVVNYIEEYDK